ncbi:MAG: hypothetical protein LBE56_07485, partial [Tannerella sp.]|nr:hypothetical protein [Tannerella sp.]
MKYKTLIIILLLFQLWSNYCRSQDIRSGIYSLQKTIDTTLLRQCFKPFDGVKNETELHFKPSYTNLIDSDFLISHAVVVNVKKEYGESVRKIVFLNNALNDYTKSIRYSDDVARKYVSLSFKVDTAGGNRSWYIEGDNDFYDLYFDLDRYDPSDYYSRTDKDKNYDVNYDRQNFYAAPDFFILKSYRYKLFRDSIYPKTGFGQASDIFYSTEQQVAIFNLEQAIDYVDIVPVQKSVVFYSEDDTQKIQLMPGDFLALRSEHDEWYYGDFVSAGGEAVSGKIMIDSLVANGKTTEVYDGKLRLSVFYTTADANGFDFEDYGVIHSIKIYNTDNQLIQV